MNIKWDKFYFPNKIPWFHNSLGSIQLKVLGKCFDKDVILLEYGSNLDTYRNILSVAFGFSEESSVVLTKHAHIHRGDAHVLHYVHKAIKISNTYPVDKYNKVAVCKDNMPIGLCKFVTKALIEQGAISK